MKTLYRSSTNKTLAGLCGGVGEMFGFDPLLIRLLLVFTCLATGIFPLLITYIVGWIVVPIGKSGPGSS